MKKILTALAIVLMIFMAPVSVLAADVLVDWTTATGSAYLGSWYLGTAMYYNNKLYTIGGYGADGATYGGTVYSSTDGVDWTLLTRNAAFTNGQNYRRNHVSVVFDNKMWVYSGSNSSSVSDAWYSTDGIDWTAATRNAEFGARQFASGIVYDGKMWLVSGKPTSGNAVNDAWYSTDGIEWIAATKNAEFTARSKAAIYVYNNKMWLVGGYNGSNVPFNDVWSSSDGISWTQENAATGFVHTGSTISIIGQTSTTGGYYWYFGTSGTATISYRSTDCINWTQDLSDANLRLSGAMATDFANTLWLTGGNGPVKLGDVVYSSIPTPTPGITPVATITITDPTAGQVFTSGEVSVAGSVSVTVGELNMVQKALFSVKQNAYWDTGNQEWNISETWTTIGTNPNFSSVLGNIGNSEPLRRFSGGYEYKVYITTNVNAEGTPVGRLSPVVQTFYLSTYTATPTVTMTSTPTATPTYVPNGSGEYTISPNTATAYQKNYYESVTYTTVYAFNNGILKLIVPTAWPTPRITDISVAVSGGIVSSPTVTGRYISVPVVALTPVTGQVFITYGSNNGITVPPTSGSYTWILQSACYGTNVAAVATASGGSNIVVISARTKTATPTITSTATPTATKTITKTVTPTATKTVTRTITETRTPTITKTTTPTRTITKTATETPTYTVTKTVTKTVTPTATKTSTKTVTPTITKTATPTITNTITATSTVTPTNTPIATYTPEPIGRNITITGGYVLSNKPGYLKSFDVLYRTAPGAINIHDVSTTAGVNAGNFVMSVSPSAVPAPLEFSGNGVWFDRGITVYTQVTGTSALNTTQTVKAQ